MLFFTMMFFNRSIRIHHTPLDNYSFCLLLYGLALASIAHVSGQSIIHLCLFPYRIALLMCNTTTTDPFYGREILRIFQSVMRCRLAPRRPASSESCHSRPSLQQEQAYRLAERLITLAQHLQTDLGFLLLRSTTSSFGHQNALLLLALSAFQLVLLFRGPYSQCNACPRGLPLALSSRKARDRASMY